jgi:hypothetical protein
MERIMKKPSQLLLVSLIFSSLATSQNMLSMGKNLVLGCIQMPSNLTSVIPMRIYCGGRKIKCEIDNEAKQIHFKIPKSTLQNKFYCLITEGLGFEPLKKSPCGETIEYMKVLANYSYKLYEIEQVAYEKEVPLTEQEKVTTDAKTKKVRAYKWIIAESILTHPDRRIPDTTIIVRYNPLFIDSLEEKNEFELPTINLKADSVLLAGSEEKLKELSTAIVIASIDADTLHSQEKEAVKFDKQRTLVTLAA